MVGYLGCGEVKDCKTYGKVSGSNAVGGLVGYMKGSDVTKVGSNGFKEDLKPAKSSNCLYKEDLKPAKLSNCVYYVSFYDTDSMKYLVGEKVFTGTFGNIVSLIENCTIMFYDPYDIIWLSVFN